MHYFQEKLEKEGKKTLYFNADLELGNVIFANSKNFINFITTQL
jgi:hypothetical protein